MTTKVATPAAGPSQYITTATLLKCLDISRATLYTPGYRWLWDTRIELSARKVIWDWTHIQLLLELRRGRM